MLEVSPLLMYFEGTLPAVRDVMVRDNVFVGDVDRVRCSTMCGGHCQPGSGCLQCPDCAHSPWAPNITIANNTNASYFAGRFDR